MSQQGVSVHTDDVVVGNRHNFFGMVWLAQLRDIKTAVGQNGFQNGCDAIL